MRCAKCHEEIAAAANFCGRCGAPLETTCPACGTVNPAAHRFCHACGAALVEGLSRPALEGERKQITVLFADLRGSLELLADQDPEETRSLLDPILECMMDAVHGFEGTVNQVMGDGIMALFGAPIAHEDHALRACCAALRMQEGVARLSEELPRARGRPVQIRVGLNSGEVVVRSIGSDLHLDYTAVGQATFLAARMEQVAAPGTIYVTGEVVRLAAACIDVKPLGPMPIKGLAEPMEVFELEAVTPTRTRFAVQAARGLTPLVGREADLDSLRRALGAAGAGHGQVVALVGEAGVGKSRVVWELIHSELVRGWRVLTASATSYGHDTVYFPVIDLLRSYFGTEGSDDARAIQDRVARRVTALDAKLGETVEPVLALLEALPADSAFRGLDAPERRRRTLEGVKALLLRESQEQPLLLVVEDLHWVDAGSRALLDALIEGLPAARLLLVVTFRPELEPGWGGLDYYTRCLIAPLPSELAGALLHVLVGDAPALEPLKELLIERCGGNPFFLEESVRTLVEAQILGGLPGAYHLARPLESVRVPASVQAGLAARIDRLRADDKELLQSAAVIGRETPYSLLHAIAGRSDEHVRRGLGRLRAADFLYEADLFPEPLYAFKHALTHEVVYGSLLRERRRVLHARIVDAVERRYADRLSDQVERLAHHAVRGEVWDKALGYLRQAGARAFAHSAHRVAVGWFEQALGVLPHLSDQRAASEHAVDVRLELRSALTPLARFDRIREILIEAERIASDLGDHRRLGVVSSFLANYFQVTGDLGRAVEHGERALDIGRRHGDATVEVVASAYLSLLYQTLGDLPRAVELARRNIAALSGERETQPFGMAILPSVYSRTALVRALADAGDFDEGAAVGAQALRIAEAMNHAYSLHFACLGLGALHLRQGECLDAIRVLERGRDILKAASAPAMSPLVGAFLGSAYTLAGRAEEALRILEQAREQAASIGFPASSIWSGVRLVALAEAHLAAGHVDRAAELAPLALQVFERLEARGYEVWALKVLGGVAATSPARSGEAEAFWRRGLGLAEGLGMRPLAEQCRLELGELHRRLGDAAQAREELAVALAAFRALRMGLSMARAQGELAKLS